MSFHTRQIDPPRYWQEFEDLCLDLYRRIWGDPGAQKNGRGGQGQAGTDVFGQPTNACGRWHGIQCKGKDTYNRGEVTEAELRTEIEKAKSFKPALTDWTLVSTAKKDAKIEEVARLITEENSKVGLFAVHVLGWEDLQSLIGDYPEVIEKYYPHLGQVNRRLLEIAVQDQGTSSEMKNMLGEILSLVKRDPGTTALSPVDPGAGTSADPKDRELQARIDSARDLLRAGHVIAALRLMEQISSAGLEDASERARFRLLTNQGAAHYRLGALELAADFFMRAHEVSNGDAIALANLALAYILRHDNAQARAMAQEALSRDPTSSAAATLRILASLDEESVTDPLALLPAAHSPNAETIATAARWYVRRGNNAEALAFFEKSLQLEPSATTTMFDLAVCLVGDILEAPAALIGKQLSAGQWKILDRAIELLSKAWDATRGLDEAKVAVDNLSNLIVLLRFCEKFDEAEDRLKEGLLLSSENPTLLLQKALLLSARSQHREAASILAILAKSEPHVAILQVDALRAGGQIEEALAVSKALGSLPEEKDRRIGAVQRIEILMQAGQLKEALEAAQDNIIRLPNSPISFAMLSHVQSRAGNETEARASAQKAMQLLDPHSRDPLDTIYTADSLYLAKDWERAADILASVTGTDYDTPALRQRVSALLNADRRQEAITLLESLSSSVISLAFYRRAAAVIYKRVGDFATAFRHAEFSLAEMPDDIEMRLLWISIADQLGESAEVNEFLNGPIIIPPETPIREKMALAHALVNRCHSKRAVEIAYNTLRTNWTDPTAHYGYQGLVLMGNVDTGIIPLTTDVIEIDTGFTLEDQPGRPGPSYIIEPHNPHNAQLGEIPPGDPLAARAIGLRVGESMKLLDFAGADSLRILEVKHKYLYLLHRSMGEFNRLFPNERGIIRFSLDPSKPESMLSRMLEFTRENSAETGEIVSAYRNGGVPIAVLAKFLSKPVIDVWYSLMEMEAKIDVSLGAQDERDRALTTLRSGPPLILDPLTFWIAGAIEILDCLHRTFGPLGITASGVEMLTRARDDRERFQHAVGTLGINETGDALVFDQPSEERKAASVALADRILSWATTQCVIVPALPKRDLAPDLRAIVRYMDPSMLDTLAAADGSGRVLLCEDRNFRGLAENHLQKGGAWLQVAMMIARRAGNITDDFYYDATSRLALAGHHFTTLDGAIFMHVAKQNGWKAEGQFRRLSHLVGDPNVEFRSMIRVASDFMKALWDPNLGGARKKAISQIFLDQILGQNRQKSDEILSALRRGGAPTMTARDQTYVRKRKLFFDFLDEYARDKRT